MKPPTAFRPSPRRSLVGLALWILCGFSADVRSEGIAVSSADSRPWPKEVAVRSSGTIATVREDSERSEYVYRSAHYEFVSDVRLSKSVVSEFSLLFEATYEALAALPLGHTLRVPGGSRQTHFRTRLFLSDASYRAAGGPASSAGVFVGRTGEVLVPLGSLGVRAVGRRVIIDSSAEPSANRTLVHELVHQLTAPDQGGTHMWYREGLAEYLASCPYEDGRFSFENRAQAVIDHLGRRKRYECLPMQEFLTLSRIGFYGAENGTGPGSGRNYTTALLLTDFLLHRDAPTAESPQSGIRRYLDAVAQGLDADDAIRLILNGRSADAFQSAFVESWRKEGVELDFATLPATPSAGIETNLNLNPR